MTYNPEATGHDQLDVLEGSITSYFAKQEQVILANECIDGQYKIVTSVVYAQQAPIVEPGFTNVCFSPNGPDCTDVENSFINAKIRMKLKLKTLKPDVDGIATTSGVDGAPQTLFVGFINSLGAFSRYKIKANSQEILTQSFVGHESFITQQGIKEDIRQRSPYVYTSYENASKRDSNVCGTYVDLSAGLDKDKWFWVEFQVKINLHQFITLSGLKYLPSFCGRWELELYPSSQNIVVLPVDPLKVCSLAQASILEANAIKETNISTSFHQLGETFNWASLFKITGTTDNSTYAQFKIVAEELTVSEIFMNTAIFQLRYEVYQALMAHYAEQPMIVPCQSLVFSKFSGYPTGAADAYHCTHSQSVDNVDSIYILVPQNERQTVCFYQPFLQGVRISLGEFGIFPARYVDTIDDPRFEAMQLDSLNLSCSQIASMNKDLARTITGIRNINKLTTDEESDGSMKVSIHQLVERGDKSKFMIGIPLSQIGFQNGTISSPNTNVPFIFDANRMSISEAGAWKPPTADKDRISIPDVDNWQHVNSSVVCMFLLDCAWAIQVIPGTDVPMVKFTSKSLA